MKQWMSTIALSLILTTGATFVLTQDLASADDHEELGKHDCDRGGIHSQVEREVSIIDNGVVITLTSENQEVVDKLHNPPEHDHEPHNEEVEREVENLENGIEITLTTDDPEILERIQTRAENGKWHPRGRHHKGDRDDGPELELEDL